MSNRQYLVLGPNLTPITSVGEVQRDISKSSVR